MNLITHDWNGSAIAQLSEAANISKHNVPAGYVNATQMCKANGKQWKHYAENESSKEFWDALSRLDGIPTDLLIVSIKTGTNAYRGTWVHPDIAIDLATWVNAEFKAWAMRTLRKIIQGNVEAPSQPSPAPQPQLLPPTPQEISGVIDLIFQNTAVDPNLVAGAKANAIIKQHPQYAAAIEAAKSALVTPVESNLLNATEVGSKIGKTAREINKLLLDYGFQVKNPEGKNPSYLPTEKGKPHSKMVLETAQGRDKTVQHLRWFESAADALLEEIENTGANNEVEQ